MIKAIIIDDEQHCINRLTTLLSKNCSDTVELLASVQSVEEGLTAVRTYKPQLVFLDIEIGNKTGFDLLKQLPEINFEVIFTTAYDKYAVQAFKFSALDYLLKPIDTDELQAALKKLNDKVSQKDIAGKFDTLFHNLKNIQSSSKRICVPVLSGLVFIQTDDIIRCESNINYTTLFLKDKQKLLVAKTLKEFEEMLTEYNFYRVHNSHLINLAYIKMYNKGKGGTVTMTDGSEIEVSTRRKDDFLKRLTDL
ncbi:LytR/AlgR family response regulator transcription factor [Parafilimonas terrae]|uniref:Two component transcriptional regulator, LytTR family n=1 Tax=Parafilimonas terrae TaxID=1465490 RepID=A0A1I5RCE2_9BACT|nr:LytTR family DNA-binding domain-containing protein [Parafilimonas terrae]SFP56090.1 two component transcriptional regulator, LytTR family [Parafilimonas terrae]